MKKTRTRLRTALTILLQEEAFEHISVSDLCRQSGVSRITFYAYYADKFALVNEIFAEMFQTASAIFHNLENRFNARDDPRISCLHLLDAVLNMQGQYTAFIMQLSQENNSYLAYAYEWYVLRKAEEYSLKYMEALQPAYSAQMVANFLCSGIWSFVRTGVGEGRTQKEIRAYAGELLELLLNSPVFPAATEEQAISVSKAE